MIWSQFAYNDTWIQTQPPFTEVKADLHPNSRHFLHETMMNLLVLDQYRSLSRAHNWDFTLHLNMFVVYHEISFPFSLCILLCADSVPGLQLPFLFSLTLLRFRLTIPTGIPAPSPALKAQTDSYNSLQYSQRRAVWRELGKVLFRSQGSTKQQTVLVSVKKKTPPPIITTATTTNPHSQNPHFQSEWNPGSQSDKKWF